jgi:membrane protein DedA with SNARE-associated domain
MPEETIFHWIAQHGYIGIFSLLVLGIVGLPVPDEGLLTFAGYLVYKGTLQLVPTVAACFLGSISGITVSYGLGRSIGLYLITKYGPLVHITPDRLEKVHAWFDRVGRWALTFGYFIPGVRHLTALVAGTSKLKIPTFALFAYSGGLIWATTFVSIGYLLGNKWARVSEKIHHHLMLTSALIAVLLVLYFLIQRTMNPLK